MLLKSHIENFKLKFTYIYLNIHTSIYHMVVELEIF